MVHKRQVLHAVSPSLHDERDGAHLLVWGDLAQWMVVDAELLGFLDLFDGRRTVKAVLRQHAKRTRGAARELEREAMAIVHELHRRGILSERPAPRAIGPEPPKVANVTVNLTNRCNLRCTWCYNAGRVTEEMPVAAVMDAIEQGREILEPNASFIVLGGEPLIDLDRLLYALDRAGGLFEPAPMVSTNGTLLTDEAVAQLGRRRVEVQVSLDSHDPARHNAVRGEGVFEQAVAGIRRLVEAGVYTIASMVYTRETVADFEPYLALAQDLGVGEARFIPMRSIGRGLEHDEARPNQTEAFQRLLDVLARRPEFRPLVRRDFFTILMTVCRYSTPRTGCGIARKVLFIDADGLVYPCPNHVGPEHCCGDLRTESLASIFADAPVLRAMRERYQVSRYTRCRACAFRYWCAGDCRGEALALTGDPLAASPHCAELRAMIKEMLWLAADGDQRLGALPTLPDGKSPVDTFVG